jgi:hypothetical protein
MPRKNPLRPELQARKDQILDLLARFTPPEEILAKLSEECGIAFGPHDLDWFKYEDQQRQIKRVRERVEASLEISSKTWCLMRLNDIAKSGAPPSEVLSAIRTRNALLKGETVNEQSWLMSELGRDEEEE